MPEDEKITPTDPVEPKTEKRFKPVTEEIKAEEPKPVETVATPAPATSTDMSEEASAKHDNTRLSVVPETNNIDNNVEDKESKKVFFKFFLITFAITLFLIALGGGIYVYISGVKNTSNPEATPTPQASTQPTPVASGEPTASPSASGKPLNSYKVSILNGNGQIGVAGDAKAIVEKAGFKVSSLGNADNFNFEKTLIQAKTSVPQSVLDTLNKSLSTKYSVTIGDNLDAKDSFDIIITIGSK